TGVQTCALPISARVLARVAHEPFQRAGEVYDGAHLLVVAVHRGELGLAVERLVEGHADLERHLLRDAIDETVGMAEHAARVADDRARGHGAVGDDLRYAIAAVALGDVVDHAVATFHAEIDV